MRAGGRRHVEQKHQRHGNDERNNDRRDGTCGYWRQLRPRRAYNKQEPAGEILRDILEQSPPALPPSERPCPRAGGHGAPADANTAIVIGLPLLMLKASMRGPRS